jgi:hypothetical protein
MIQKLSEKIIDSSQIKELEKKLEDLRDCF